MKKNSRLIIIVTLLLGVFFIVYKTYKGINQEVKVPINMAIIGDTIDNTDFDFGEFKDYLSKEMKTEVNVITVNDVDTLINNFNNKKFHLAYITADKFYRMSEIVKPMLVANKLINGSDNKVEFTSYHGSELITKKDFNEDIKSLKGKNIEVYDSDSIDGYILPINELKEKGIDLRKENNIKIVGSYIDMINDLLDDKADIVCVPEGLKFDIKSKLKDDIDKLKVYYKTDKKIPNNMIVFNRDVSDNIVKKINDILIVMHEKESGKNLLDKINVKKFEKIDNDKLDNIKKYE